MRRLSIFTWRVYKTYEPRIYLEGTEYSLDEARNEAVKARSKMRREWDMGGDFLSAFVHGPRGAKFEYRRVRGLKRFKWAKVK